MGRPMKPLLIIFCLIISIVQFCAIRTAAMILPVSQPEYQFLYDAARRSEIISKQYRLYHYTAPYNLNEIGVHNPMNMFGDSTPGDKLTAFLFLSEDLLSARYAHSRSYESIRGGVMGQPTERLSFYGAFLLDERLAKDPDYRGKKWRGLAGEMETAVFNYRDNHFDILLGRFGGNWGPENQSLVLSSTSLTMDALLTRFKWGRLFFTYQLGQLDRLRTNDSTEYFQNRYFVGHRLDIQLADHLNLGLFETAVFGGAGRGIELGYLNPLMFYHSFQLNDSVDDNTFLGIDFSYYIKQRHKIYGQILFDDFQIEKKSAGDNEPNEIGYMLGFHSLDLGHIFDFQGEYLRINNRTYNQKLQRNRYLNRGELIGHELGPDSDQWKLSFIRWFEYQQRLSLDISYERQGEGAVNTIWTEPWLSTPDYHESFPTGTVEKKLSASLQFAGFVKGFAYIEVSGGIESCRNFDHIAGDNRTIPFFKARLTFILSTSLNNR